MKSTITLTTGKQYRIWCSGQRFAVCDDNAKDTIYVIKPTTLSKFLTELKAFKYSKCPEHQHVVTVHNFHSVGDKIYRLRKCFKCGKPK